MRMILLVAAAASVLAHVGSPPAHADAVGALNGTYIATSLGNLAKTNSRYHDEAIVRSTWTVSTTCSFADICAGTVTSDQGWSAEVHHKSGQWFVKRDLPDWAPCPDGVTTSPGQQIFKFYPADSNGQALRNSRIWAGWDETTGVSGACGHNLQQQITMPFRLDQIA